MAISIAPPPAKTKLIHEYVALEVPKKVDRETRMIHDVKLLGRYSRDSSGKIVREYSQTSLNTAARMYRGLPVYSDHPASMNPYEVRKVEDQLGCLMDDLRVVWEDSDRDGLYGSMHYLSRAKNGDLVAEAAEEMPHVFGFSHNAECEYRTEAQIERITDIQHARSVDVVTRPGTTRGMFESENQETRTVKTTIEEMLKKIGDSEMQTAIAAMLEIEGDLGAVAMEVPEDESLGSTPEQIRGAFKAAIAAVFDDSSIDTKATIKKISELVRAAEKAMEMPENEEKEPTEEETGDSSESESSTAETTESQTVDAITKLTGRLETMEKRFSAINVLGSFNLTATDVNRTQLDSLLKAENEDGMRAIVESWPAVMRRPRVRERVPELVAAPLSGRNETFDELLKRRPY